MNILGLILIVFTSLQTSLIDIRKLYQEAVKDEEQLHSLVQVLHAVDKTSQPELIAYKGASMALRSKQAKTIKAKKKYFLEAVDYLEFAATSKKTSPEVRFIRLSVQVNTPKFLKYKSHIDSDKQFIIDRFHLIEDKNLRKYIKAFILETPSFSDEERRQLINRN